jgi:hypothetical protein
MSCSASSLPLFLAITVIAVTHKLPTAKRQNKTNKQLCVNHEVNLFGIIVY